MEIEKGDYMDSIEAEKIIRKLVKMEDKHFSDREIAALNKAMKELHRNGSKK